MNPSAFDPSHFSQQTFEGELDTKPMQVPTAEYVALLKAPEFRQTQGKKDPSKWYTWCDINMELQLPPEIAETLNRTIAPVRHSFALDLTESGNLDMRKGANWRLGQILAACKLNTPWSFSDIGGKLVKVKIKGGEGDAYSEVEAIGVAD